LAYTDPVKEQAYKEKYRLQYHRRKRWIDKIKLSAGCEICGYKEHPAALDFDHKNPDEKEFLIPRFLGRGNIARLFREIRKCRVICANCHRVHSRDQWNSGQTRKFMNNGLALQ
jgi:hypothetical protein